MLKLGCHLSSSKGFLEMGRTAEMIGANTFQFFTRNPRGGKARPVDEEDIHKYTEFAEKRGISVIMAHAPYTMNACSADPGLRQFALEMMTDDLERLKMLPGAMYNFHPGSHVKQGPERGIALIAEMLNKALSYEGNTIVLLETMAGKGSEVGRSFEELRSIIDRVDRSDRLGVCMDTCHVHDAGYDIKDDLNETLEEFDRVIGLDRLKALHLNDSKNPMGSRKDRHEKLGDGYLGLDAFRNILKSAKLSELPMFLETPNDIEGYEREIKILKDMLCEE